MELKAEPESGEDLLADRIYFWEKMVWQSKQAAVDINNIYLRTVWLLTYNNINLQ